MKMKKIILSIVTISAISTAVSADTHAQYIPMTTKSHDKAWVMFGINNFATGIPTVESAGGIAMSNGVDEDDVGDNLATPVSGIGTIASATDGFKDVSGNYNLATFQALKDANGVAYFNEPVTLDLNTTGLSYSETQPVRSMYIAIKESATTTSLVSKIKLNYKAVLEGRTGSIQLNHEGHIYSFTIDQTATFNSPAIAQYTEQTTTVSPLSKPEDLIVYNLSKAPVNAITYDKTKHQGVARGNERFYYYDAANGNWLLWDRTRVTNGQNTLTNFEQGKAYWGRIDINGDASTTSDARAGMYVATTGKSIADASVYTGKLTTDSWNMISFDAASHPDIRNATTGLLIGTNALADGDAITLTDETGVNSITITFATAADYPNDVDRALYINKVIQAKKYLGEIPKNFNIKAFATNVSDKLLFLSDKQFTVKDTTGDILADAKTIANRDVLNYDGSVASVSDVKDGTSQANTAATSRYGEYSLIIKPLVDTGTASKLDNDVSGGGGASSAAVQFGNIDGDSLNGSASSPLPRSLADGGTDEASTLTTAQTQLSGDDVFDGGKSSGRILQIDTDFSGSADMLLLATDKSFYIKDHTYTRTYEINSGVDGTDEANNPNVSYKIKNTTSATLTPADDDTATEFVTAINAIADTGGATDTKAYAAKDSGNKLVVVTADSSLMDLIDANSALKDYFKRTTSSDPIAKGAVSQVLNIAKLTRENVILNKVKLAFTADSNSTQEIDITLNVGTTAIDPTNTTGINVANDTDRLTILDDLVNQLNNAFQTANVAASAYHIYKDGYNDITKASLYIEGVDISHTSFNQDADGDGTLNELNATVSETATNPGKLDTDAAVIVNNLKDNAVYSPDYVNYGPLYTLKEAGYEAKAIVRPSTNIAATPTTHWDGIDLTKDSSQWLQYNEYNLFSVDNVSGYWVYVTAYTPPTISVSNTVFSPTYAYHFDRSNNTDNIISSVSFSTQISGIDPATSNVKLVVGGNEIELVNTGSTYTANISTYATTLLSQQSNTFRLNVTNGLGDRFENTSFLTLDYAKPETPSITFAKAAQVTINDTSSDVAAYYLWKDYIPDEGAGAIGPISLTDATAYNMCQDTAFGSTQNYQLVAIDGKGTFGKGNISNMLPFNFANTVKDATVLTHNYGDSTSTAENYDSNCDKTTQTLKHGVEVYRQTVGTVRLAFEPKNSTGENATNDIPLTAYYALPSATTDAVVRIDLLDLYVGKKFYIEYNGALYSGTFPSNAAAADASFNTPIVLTSESNVANQTLQ